MCLNFLCYLPSVKYQFIFTFAVDIMLNNMFVAKYLYLPGLFLPHHKLLKENY